MLTTLGLYGLEKSRPKMDVVVLQTVKSSDIPVTESSQSCGPLPGTGPKDYVYKLE
ncbi:hypothetical protein SAMD00023353_0700010 [Rosellinia necatrix]|uniref:Uncharacterized protein n=1 Tax=Rosellinia necatrix TaxID=77044 RepID=A0A1S7ULL5_ROSNE|nr:hypothetical protein SAMD00023353_0700010 [Rosellinia necatrix]